MLAFIWRCHAVNTFFMAFVEFLSIETLNKQKRQPEFITRKSLLIVAHATTIFWFSSRNADAHANDQLTSGYNPYVVWHNKQTRSQFYCIGMFSIHTIIINHKWFSSLWLFDWASNKAYKWLDLHELLCFGQIVGSLYYIHPLAVNWQNSIFIHSKY